MHIKCLTKYQFLKTIFPSCFICKDDGGDSGIVVYIFHVYYNGKFEVPVGNITRYVGGEVHLLLRNPQSLFCNLIESLSMSLCGQMIWYKLPYENMTELKLMCNGDDNF